MVTTTAWAAFARAGQPFSEDVFPNIQYKPPHCNLSLFPLILDLDLNGRSPSRAEQPNRSLGNFSNCLCKRKYSRLSLT